MHKIANKLFSHILYTFALSHKYIVLLDIEKPNKLCPFILTKQLLLAPILTIYIKISLRL